MALPMVRFDLNPSPSIGRGLLLIYFFTALVVLKGPLFILFKPIIVIPLVCWGYYQIHLYGLCEAAASVVAIGFEPCELQFRDGTVSEFSLLRQSRVYRHWVTLRLAYGGSKNGGSKKRWLVIPRDSLSPRDFRAIKRYLRTRGLKVLYRRKRFWSSLWKRVTPRTGRGDNS